MKDRGRNAFEQRDTQLKQEKKTEISAMEEEEEEVVVVEEESLGD